MFHDLKLKGAYFDWSKASKSSMTSGPRTFFTFLVLIDVSAVLNLAMKLSRRVLNWKVSSRSSTAMALKDIINKENITSMKTLWNSKRLHRTECKKSFFFLK